MRLLVINAKQRFLVKDVLTKVLLLVLISMLHASLVWSSHRLVVSLCRNRDRHCHRC